MSLDPDIRDNEEAKRYELTVDGETAVIIYNPVAGGRLITETLVPVALEGRGIASRMARHILADLKAKGLVVLPTCPFFSGYLKKHPEYADQVHPTYRAMLGL
ncbi:N-acetyltransferase [Brevundimonas naejangsanensis]|uniref:N-acetyltransferase n=1 Tax=Brevundimonas naejangsanensis TaxID=588932 RepID=A0A494RIH0_9CAUL|nr:GNAT family N-acetyltransferase [Brevundimonas naejangsanensis]AYG94833.1 N-acetyltransferase [Brevundimonas naejangsanensis]